MNKGGSNVLLSVGQQAVEGESQGALLAGRQVTVVVSVAAISRRAY